MIGPEQTIGWGCVLGGGFAQRVLSCPVIEGGFVLGVYNWELYPATVPPRICTQMAMSQKSSSCTFLIVIKV